MEDSNRLLNGPTNDVWLTPWVEYLQQRGVDFQTGTVVKGFNTSAGGIRSVTVERNGEVREITANHYISALPIEIMTGLVDDSLKALAPSFATLDKLRTEWMNGIQFYLAQDVPLEFGHTLYADSPWAITSISQRQFWNHSNLADFGDGRVRGILSVDISDWETPGIVYGRAAMQCSADEIKKTPAKPFRISIVVQLVRKEEAVKTSRLVLLIIFITTTIVAAVKLSCALIAAQTSGPAIEFKEGTDLKMEVSECLSFIRDQVLRNV